MKLMKWLFGSALVVGAVSLLAAAAYSATSYVPGQQLVTTLTSTDYIPVQHGPLNVAISAPNLASYVNAPSGPFTVTSNSSHALAVGANGTTNPAFVVDASASSAATGVKVTAAAAASGVSVAAVSSGTNEGLKIDAKGSGTLALQGTGTGGISLGTAVTGASSIKSSSASGGIGYTTGAGCAVTQGSSRTTTVVCTGTTGAITLVSAAGSATPATFTVTNTSVAATDTIIVNQKSGTDLYETFVTNVGGGSFKITFFTTGGTTTEQPVFNFAVIKGAAS